MKRLLLTDWTLPLFVFSLTLSLNALGYSESYCNITIRNEQTAALKNRDWSQLLRISEERERNCGRFSTADSIATSILFQATALGRLGRLSESITEANRCITLFPLPDCYIEKGNMLVELERYDEAERSIREGKNLIQIELKRLDSELSSSGNLIDKLGFESSSRALRSSNGFADSLLERIDTMRKGKETEELMRRFSESVPRKPMPDGSKVVPASRSKGTSFSIPLRRRGGVFEVMATLNSEVKVYFVVDSGASDVTIPESVAGLLMDNGSLTKADLLGSREYRFANGETSSGKVVRLRTLDLNGHILKDVRAVVLPGNSVPVLLGQSALGQLGSWSINAKAQKLEVTP